VQIGDQAHDVPGGGGLFSTAPDYLTFVQMLLNGGSHGGAYPQAGDGRPNGKEPHRRHRSGHPEDRDAGTPTSISSPATA
jgi:CubicO group peptidase (beta-lactamase class C family)